MAPIGAILLSYGWLSPGTLDGAIVPWVGVFVLGFVSLSVAGPRYRPFLLAGLVLNTIGFYWLCNTISLFGGFSIREAVLIFFLYAIFHSIQFVLFAFLFRSLPRIFDTLALRFACAWTATELLPIRIFPWQVGHTQIAFPAFTQIASISGSLSITFLMFWNVEAILRRSRGGRSPALFIPFLFTVAGLIFGYTQIQRLARHEYPKQKVALVQANISLEEKNDAARVGENRERNAALTQKIATPGLLAVWPESAIQDWIRDDIRDVKEDPRLPRFEPPINLITGALTYHSRSEIFNSALAITSAGVIFPPYHKQVLMPFGEYTPLSDVFPWLKEINSAVTDFTPGKEVRVYSFPAENSDKKSFNVSPLICYEDLIPSPAREATRLGAEILINFTNDAWYGLSHAASNHHLIASFRSIENHRYLLRATNTGLTGVVNPLGQTEAALPQFAEGVIEHEVDLIDEQTLYTRFFGQKLWWAMTFVVFIAVGWNLSRKKKPGSGRSR